MAADGSAGGVPIHLESTPSGAVVRIDGVSRGQTPLDTLSSPGQHSLTLQHPVALDDEQPLYIADSGANVDVGLWQRRPAVVPLRPVYPGAALVDARFLNDGQVSLLVEAPTQSGAGAKRELWRLDPTTTQLTRVSVPVASGPKSTIVLAPDGEQVAYVTLGTASDLSASLWPKSGTLTPSQREARPDSVWVAPAEEGQPPRRIFDLPSASGPGAASDPERIVDLVWTPDGSRLVAITRQTGPPTRARVFVVQVPTADAANNDSQAAADQLVLLPAEVLPDSAVLDPTGRWLALVTHAAVAPGGNNLLSLCVLQLQAGGTFRDVADLGSALLGPIAPVAWPPATGANAGDRLVFVGPAPAAASGSGGLFGIFGALRPSTPPSGLFMADLEKTSRLEDAQPHRLGTAINNFAPVWRSETTLFGFARLDDGTLALHSIDPTSGAVHDLGVRLPTGTAQGATGLSARWDTRHGNALLLAGPPSGGTSGANPGRGPLQAWLVSFVSPSSPPGATH